mmetsp:Transcript_40205/g.87886  ORF Transcript_40205/g.87886 Transcript_40205/m.87886 type:complete len:89 (+) Transcript_40205:176-442(+)
MVKHYIDITSKEASLMATPPGHPTAARLLSGQNLADTRHGGNLPGAAQKAVDEGCLLSVGLIYVQLQEPVFRKACSQLRVVSKLRPTP